MFKLVVLSAILSVCFAKPGYLHGGLALPAATSYSSRVDVHHSTPIISKYVAPIVTKTIVAEPLHYGGYPGHSVSHSSTYNVHPSYGSYGHGYSLGHEGYGLGYGGYGLGHGGYELGHGLGHGSYYGGW